MMASLIDLLLSVASIKYVCECVNFYSPFKKAYQKNFFEFNYGEKKSHSIFHLFFT